MFKNSTRGGFVPILSLFIYLMERSYCPPAPKCLSTQWMYAGHLSWNPEAPGDTIGRKPSQFLHLQTTKTQWIISQSLCSVYQPFE